ncbi:DUF7093 family protein [Halobellus ordinarius]|uniref:DUF7093 family protein n=1 Tax=Halobellus ordinarius TaxID=3075120 RepID=UPI00287FF410|nr:hypothetical protein [Halobellus sp. ZY16]
MGLRCRLHGHTYGEPEVERSREEIGNEVVVTVREVKVCDRCGAEETVSENKEVTALRSPSELGLDEGSIGSSASKTPPESEGKSESTQTAVYSDGEMGDDEQTTEEDSDTKVYQAADSDASAAGTGQPDSDREEFAQASTSTSTGSDATDEVVEFFCPNCGRSRIKDTAMLRPGDICPECKQGYIAERRP